MDMSEGLAVLVTLPAITPTLPEGLWLHPRKAYKGGSGMVSGRKERFD